MKYVKFIMAVYSAKEGECNIETSFRVLDEIIRNPGQSFSKITPLSFL